MLYHTDTLYAQRTQATVLNDARSGGNTKNLSRNARIEPDDMHIVYAVHQQSNKQKIYLYDEERSESFRCLYVCIIPHFVFTRSAL